MLFRSRLRGRARPATRRRLGPARRLQRMGSGPEGCAGRLAGNTCTAWPCPAGARAPGEGPRESSGTPTSRRSQRRARAHGGGALAQRRQRVRRGARTSLMRGRRTRSGRTSAVFRRGRPGERDTVKPAAYTRSACISEETAMRIVFAKVSTKIDLSYLSSLFTSRSSQPELRPRARDKAGCRRRRSTLLKTVRPPLKTTTPGCSSCATPGGPLMPDSSSGTMRRPSCALHSRQRRVGTAVRAQPPTIPSCRTHHRRRRVGVADRVQPPAIPSCRTHHRRRHAGYGAPGDSFLPDSPPVTTCRGCRLCANRGDPFVPDSRPATTRRGCCWCATRGDPYVPDSSPTTTRRGCRSCANYGDPFVPDLPPTTTCRGCCLCATRGGPSVSLSTIDDALGLPSVRNPRRFLPVGVITGDDVHDCRSCATPGDSLMPGLGDTRRLTRRNLLPRPFLPTPSVVPGQGSPASRGPTRPRLAGHGLVGARRHAPFDSAQSRVPPRSTYTISGAWARLRHVVKPHSPPSCRPMEAPWACPESAARVIRLGTI